MSTTRAVNSLIVNSRLYQVVRISFSVSRYNSNNIRVCLNNTCVFVHWAKKRVKCCFATVIDVSKFLNQPKSRIPHSILSYNFQHSCIFFAVKSPTLGRIRFGIHICFSQSTKYFFSSFPSPLDFSTEQQPERWGRFLTFSICLRCSRAMMPHILGDEMTIACDVCKER